MIELIPVDNSHLEEVFHRLLQLYEYEFSNITRLEVNPEGFFITEDLNKALANRTCKSLLLKYKGKWAGFVVVNLKSYLNDDPQVRDIAEFFVMKLYRRHLLGQKMAFEVFKLFPGSWEVRQLPLAREARDFWLKVIDRFTEHKFTESLLETPRWKGYVQAFTVK